MTDLEKIRAIVRLFEADRRADAFFAMEWMLKDRGWPAWLTETARQIDGDRNVEGENG